MKYLNIGLDTIKVLEENRGSKVSDIPHSSIFTDTPSRARDIKKRINKWGYIKLKSFCRLKETSSKSKGNKLYGKIYMSMIPWANV